jgi:hypothetical protein
MVNYSIQDYDRALEKAGRFIRGLQNPDGSVKGINPDTFWGYYSQPLGLRGLGSPEDWNRANRCVDYIKRRFLNPDGSIELVTESRWKEKVISGDLYAAAFLIHGAAVWERFDVAGPMINYLLKYQDRESGGIFHRTKNRRFIEASATADAGIGMIMTGHITEAVRAGHFLVKIHDAQPDFNKRYLTIWDTQKKELFDGDSTVKDIPDSNLVRENPGGANTYWEAGYTIAFMVDLYNVTRNKEYLRVAQELFEILSGYKGFNFHIWKIPWACARLYQTTGEQKYLDTARTMADRIVSMQQSDGGFSPGASARPEYSYSELQSDIVELVDVACQLAFFMSEVRAIL